MSTSYKVILIGETEVGKSSCFVRFRDGKFVENLVGTIGLDECTTEISFQSEDKKSLNSANIQLWDTAGLEKSGRLTNNHYLNSRGVILMYDVTEYSSFSCLSMWCEEAERYTNSNAPNVRKPIFFLVGNKIDCTQTEIEISEELSQAFAKKRNIPAENVFRMSVKTSKGFSDMFSAVAKCLSANMKPTVQHNKEPFAKALQDKGACSC